VYCIDPENGHLIWKFRTRGGNIEGSITGRDGVIYFGSFDHHMYSVDARTGRLRWKFRTRDKVASTPAVDGDMLYFGGKDQFVYALDINTGKLAWKFKTQDCIISSPTVAGKRVLIASYDRFMYCLDKDNGHLLWKFRTQGEIHNCHPFAVRDGIVYFDCFDNVLRAVDIETGRLVWGKRIGQYGCEATTSLYEGVLYNPCRNGILYAVTTDGTLLWKYVTKEVTSCVCRHGDRLYMGSSDHFMHCLSLDGKPLWKFKAQGNVWFENLMIGKRLIFGSWDCNVYCLDTETMQLAWKFNTGGSPAPMPTAYEYFEVEMKVPEARAEDRKKTYDLNLGGADSGDDTSAYKSRITYQLSTQYASKGKYQVDSDQEGF
jgi:outer membrane protein assembly factor BamB